ncbi:MAG: hypothetical protein AAGA38_05845 [Pseudomonadota bacterium]
MKGKLVRRLSIGLPCLIGIYAAISLDVHSASAQEEITQSSPQIGGNIISRLGYNGDYRSDAPLIEADDVFIQIIASPIIHFSDKLRFNTELRVETVTPPTEDRVFEDQGLFARILQLEYDVTDRLSIHAGKMTPSFALASFIIPGMYGNSYNKEIELIDRVGLGADYDFGGGQSGTHTLSFNAFFEDTSVFSESLGTNRGRTSIDDGGASNTESLNSFALSLEGRDMHRFPGLTYKLGLLHQKRGVDGVADENGFSATVMQTLENSNSEEWSFIGEFAAFENFEGTNDDIIYASGGIVYRTSPWMAVLSGTLRPRYLADGGKFDDYSIQTSLEYDLGNGFSLAVAHELNRDENLDNRRLGFRFSKVIELSK